MTALCFCCKETSLGIVKDLWEASSDGKGSSTIGIYKKFTRDHFGKNSFNRMRVYLAVQILSLTTIQMTEDSLKNLIESILRKTWHFSRK